MLKNTLILPESDGRLASQMLRDAIDSLDVVLMLVLGRGNAEEQIVLFADQLCNKTQTPDGNLRRVVWVRDLSTATMQAAIDDLTDGAQPRPQVIVLNFFDQVKATLAAGDPAGPLDLELAFLKGHQ